MKDALRFALAVAVPAAAAAALVPLRSDLPNATVALALAVVVTVLAAAGTRLSAAIAAASAGLSFDGFFTRPYDSLAIRHAVDLETTALLLVVGLVVGQVATRNRHHRRQWEGVSYDLGRVHSVAEMVASGEPVDQVVLAVANELRDLLHLRTCRYDAVFPEQPGPFVERDGAVSWGALSWDVTTAGMPSKETTLVVEHQGRPLGRYALVAPVGTRVTPDQLLAAVALADQAGAAIAAQGIPT